MIRASGKGGWALLGALGLLGCGPKSDIVETTMVHAPARAPDCRLELVQADPTSMAFNQRWEVLGYISLGDRGRQDPTSAENRAIVRPRACAMGGTSIAVALSATSTNVYGSENTSLMYMVMRKKPTGPARATAF